MKLWHRAVLCLVAAGLLALFRGASAAAVVGVRPRRGWGGGLLRMSGGPDAELRIKQSNGEPEVLRRAADFLSRSMYPEQIPEGQRKELRNLEFQDLQNRYGQVVGRRLFPSSLILTLEDQDIVGCVGCDVQVLSLEKKRFAPIKQDKSNLPFAAANEETAFVMANLAVRRNRRGRGIAKNLIAAAEQNARDWGFSQVHLLVDSENLPAQKLYRKLGYSLLFKQEDATCVASGPVGLKTQDCVNLCMRKSVKKNSSGGLPFANALSDFFSAFGGKK